MEDEDVDEGGHQFQSDGQSSGRGYEEQARHHPGYLPKNFSQVN